MQAHRYILEKYTGVQSRHTCPNCGKRREFTRYIDTETGGQLADHAGMCNRVNTCGYHYTPKQFLGEQLAGAGGSSQLQKTGKRSSGRLAGAVRRSNVYILDSKHLARSMKEEGYSENKFVAFLYLLFDADTVQQLIKRYYIGNSCHWPGATVFWQLDTGMQPRTGKIMLYDAATGKRVKTPFNYVTWMHSTLDIPGFELRQCLFGAHLLKDNKKPVAIVESEKTAVIASHYLPGYTWLACGGVHGITAEKFEVLRGRDIILYPDAGMYEAWEHRAKKVLCGFKVELSCFLTDNLSAGEQQQGMDIADYFIKYSKERVQDDETLIQVARELTTAARQFNNGHITHGAYLSITKDIEQRIKAGGRHTLQDLVELTKDI